MSWLQISYFWIGVAWHWFVKYVLSDEVGRFSRCLCIISCWGLSCMLGISIYIYIYIYIYTHTHMYIWINPFLLALSILWVDGTFLSLEKICLPSPFLNTFMPSQNRPDDFGDILLERIRLSLFVDEIFNGTKLITLLISINPCFIPKLFTKVLKDSDNICQGCLQAW